MDPCLTTQGVEDLVVAASVGVVVVVADGVVVVVVVEDFPAFAVMASAARILGQSSSVEAVVDVAVHLLVVVVDVGVVVGVVLVHLIQNGL